MKNIQLAFYCMLTMVFCVSNAGAEDQHATKDVISNQGQVSEEQRLQNAAHPTMKLHGNTGAIADDEYIIMDMVGSVTRSACPYTCEDRGLAKQNCRAFQAAKDKSQCYVQDTRIKSNAFSSSVN